MSTSGYKTNRTGFIFGTEFEQKTNLFVNLELSNYYEDLEALIYSSFYPITLL